MGILNSLDIGKKGLEAHGMRVEVAAKNIANVDTPNYVRKIPILSATENTSFSAVLGDLKSSTGYTKGSVQFEGVVEDPTLGDRIYKPGHPDADENGYIMSSNVNPMVDIADALLAQKAYEASLSIMNISKTMASRALEIGQ